MHVFRIVQDKVRTTDLSGTGGFRRAGRWNSKGTYMLYTSENRSLALLENLIHFDKGEMPPDLFIIEINIVHDSLIFTLPDSGYSPEWKKLSLIENQKQGDQWMQEMKWLGVKVKSAVNPEEYNYLLNPLFPRYYDLVKIVSIREISLDERLIRLVNNPL